MLHSDHERVQQARAGDPAARQWLAEQLVLLPRMVRQIAMRSVRLPVSEWEDAAQDAAVVVIRRLATYHGRAPFEAWLFVICLLTMRARARRRRESTALRELDPVDADPADRPLLRLLDGERSQRLRDAVARLGGVEAEILQLVHFGQLDFGTISARTGIGIPTLRTRYYRALGRLRAMLAAGDAEDHSP